MLHTIQELQMRQRLPLEAKVAMSKTRIREWIEKFGIDGVYVSFSGGKDSTVLLNLVREDYPDAKAVFVDTGLEYPEIREFVRTFENVDIVRPKMNFRQVIDNFGYPFISKEVSKTVYYARKYLSEYMEKSEVVGDWAIADLLNIYPRREKAKDPEAIKAYNEVKNGDFLRKSKAYEMAKANGDKINSYTKILFGELEHKEKGKLTDEYSNQYDRSRYKFFLGAPFEISSACCDVMKKAPVKAYAKATNRKAITGQMADESQLRTQKWLNYGCNGFDMKYPISNPLSFWTEQDILKYIKENSIKICNVYGDVVIDYEAQNQLIGQMDITDFGLSEDKRKLKTTGCSRTGCMFCGYGCHLEKPGEGRFEKMKETHPKIYDYIMRPKEKGGLGYKEIIDWINENGDLDIRY